MGSVVRGKHLKPILGFLVFVSADLVILDLLSFVNGFHLAVLMKHYRLRHRCQGLCAINGAWCALGEECKGNSN